MIDACTLEPSSLLPFFASRSPSNSFSSLSQPTELSGSSSGRHLTLVHSLVSSPTPILSKCSLAPSPPLSLSPPSRALMSFLPVLHLEIPSTRATNCLIQYDVDTTGTWGNTTIQLMSGSNLDMVVVADVVTGLDGSTGGVINWECPDVTPNSQIYFYQYSAPGQATSWTGRFTIASATGDSTDPANSTTTGGVTVNYGYGALTDPSETIAAPIISGGVTGSGSSATSRASGSSAATSSAASSSASSSASSAASSSSSEAQSSSESESAATVTSTEASSSSSGSSSSSSSSASSAASSAAASSTPASGAASLQIGGALSALVGLVGIIALA